MFGGILKKFGTDSYGISGTFCALAFACASAGAAAAKIARTPSAMRRFMVVIPPAPGTVARSVAARAPRVGRTRHRQELPSIAVARQRELDDAEGFDLHLAVGGVRHEIVERRAAGADGELADALRLVAQAVRRLRREALIEMIVAVEDDLDAGVVEDAPEIAHVGVEAVRARREQRMVPVRERALVAVRREVGLKPRPLRRVGADADALTVIAVERDDVPVAEVVTVVADAGHAGLRAEVAVVRRRVGKRFVLVVAGNREGAREE